MPNRRSFLTMLSSLLFVRPSPPVIPAINIVGRPTSGRVERTRSYYRSMKAGRISLTEVRTLFPS